LSEGTLIADRFDLQKEIGKGGYGSVWQALDTTKLGLCAIKLVNLNFPCIKLILIEQKQISSREGTLNTE
jgi:hypothetical protein